MKLIFWGLCDFCRPSFAKCIDLCTKNGRFNAEFHPFVPFCQNDNINQCFSCVLNYGYANFYLFLRWVPRDDRKTGGVSWPNEKGWRVSRRPLLLICRLLGGVPCPGIVQLNLSQRILIGQSLVFCSPWT